MNLYLWALFAGGCAVAAEVIFRTYAHLGFWRLECFVIFLQIGVGYGVYKIFTSVETFIIGAIIFPFGTMIMRLAAQIFIFHEIPSTKVFIAFGFIVAAQLVRILPIK
jgi:hypothetical protein